ncbi:MAG: FtsW/RodA/SpoVE family cell cycle protein [Tannerella sp.]|jgi:cell division protein FtsW|nr:FtsW/RodA/SpoVE family cell cycle protein [Tannerella sp.]
MKNNVLRNVFCGDLSVWIIYLLLVSVSITEVFSATSILAYKGNILSPISRHVGFLAAGFLIVLGLAHSHCKFFSLGILLLPCSAVLLFLTMMFGKSTNDATRFLSIFGFQFQPSELGKLACILYVAFLLSQRSRFSDDRIYKMILWGIVPIIFLIVFSNFSTAFLLSCVCFLLMFIGQIPFKKLGKLLLVVSVAISVFVLGYFVLPKEITKYYPDRFVTWVNRITDHQKTEENNNKGKFTQVDYAKIAIFKGGIIGKAPGRSDLREFLPQAFSDFIYAIIIEETGMFGGVCVLLLYVMLMIRVGVIARRCEKLFPKYLVIGCGLIITIQALINMSVAVNLIPVTGQPLPLISRGGTSILLTSAYIGIILSISHFGANMSEDETEETEIETKKSETADDKNPEENPIFAVETNE